MATFIIVLLTIISILSAIFVIGIILIQQNKAGGGLGAVSGGWTESTFGASADNVLTKATTWASAIFLISTLLLAAVTGRWGIGRKSIIESTDIAEKPAAVKVEEAAKPAVEAVKAEETKPAEAAPAKAEEAKPAEAAKPAAAAPAEEKK